MNKPTKQQEELIKLIGRFGVLKKKPGQLYIGRARAGTGKTTTLMQAAIAAADAGQQVLVGVYNKPIAVEWQSKLLARGFGKDDGITVTTWHALGLRVLSTSFNGKIRIEEGLLEKLVKPFGLAGRVWAGTLKLTALAKQELLKFDGADWQSTIEHYGLDSDYRPEELGRIESASRELLKRSLEHFEKTKEVDFTDMLYLPWLKDLEPHSKFDVVCVDEAQDSNQARIDLAFKSLRKGGLLVPVGDDRQAIYGFSGARASALEDFQEIAKQRGFETNEKGLTVCFRCPKEVVKRAQAYVPDIEAWDGAGEGVINNFVREKAEEELRSGDAVLCRLNAPLAGLALKLLRAKRPCRIEGRDFSKQLLTLAGKFGKDLPLIELINRLRGGLVMELGLLEAKGASEAKLEQLRDKYQTLVFFCEELLAQEKGRFQDLRELFQELFDDTQPGHKGFILLSSIHKAKGREWKRVWLWGFNSYFVKAQQDWQKRQEENLRYVAVTRSQEELYFVN